ncbi:hypothetical protein B0H17DRAFT_574791 [Mycena rosella]|uniref:Uncharacterized protein n=1 Tax=Mycena rosella TaxID=1033263 RepID=A0AAD7DH59_MYCRO|nr:hypothetical protein B0H17DRAFT_574791 [Mycena rosella]
MYDATNYGAFLAERGRWKLRFAPPVCKGAKHNARCTSTRGAGRGGEEWTSVLNRGPSRLRPPCACPPSTAAVRYASLTRRRHAFCTRQASEDAPRSRWNVRPPFIRKDGPCAVTCPAHVPFADASHPLSSAPSLFFDVHAIPFPIRLLWEHRDTSASEDSLFV